MAILPDTLISPGAMADVDAATVASGIPGWQLMAAAGRSVASRVLACFPEAQRAVVLCGPGNNGGDGYVAACGLRDAGMDVAVFALGSPDALRGDAARAYSLWGRKPDPLEECRPETGDVVVDALFGAGLSRPITGVAADCIERIAGTDVPVLAVDLPSGVSGLSGRVLGTALPANETVTFFARKPGHVLMPGRSLCGALQIADIGIPARFAHGIDDPVRENSPNVWAARYPAADAGGHKYTRGHLGVFSGPLSATGAARLSAAAGLAAGAGLVTLASPAAALTTIAAHMTAVMVRRVDDAEAAADWVADKRLSAFVLGPGFGPGPRLRAYALMLGGRNLVLDADGITAFSDDPAELFAAFSDQPVHLVLTPHSGEFMRLFPDIAGDEALSKVEAAQKAAVRANAVVVLKGADTVIAAPDGRALINSNAPPWLATAGSGDVLSGIVGGLAAQGMPAFEAAAAGVWIHGEAGRLLGRGLTADSLSDAVARVRLDGSHRAFERI